MNGRHSEQRSLAEVARALRKGIHRASLALTLAASPALTAQSEATAPCYGDCAESSMALEARRLAWSWEEEREYRRERERRREQRYEERAQRARERARERAERREMRDRERRADKKLRSLRRQLDEEGRSRYSSRSTSYSSQRRNTSGGMCMYGIGGELIHQPPDRLCPPTRSEYARSGSRPISEAGVGCVSGDCREGLGTYIWPGGASYTGQFAGGLQHGEGTMSYANGATYTGAWNAGKRHGMGTALYPGGASQSGLWKDNTFVKPLSSRPTAQGTAPRTIDWPDLSRSIRRVGGGEDDVAVVIGIDRYAHVPRIPGAALNASDWYRYLVKSRGVAPDNVTLLLNENATREQMLEAARSAAQRAGKKSSLWFVFVGHGTPSPGDEHGLLVGYDAQQKANSLAERSLGQDELMVALEQSRARSVHVFLDACFSGRTPSGEPLAPGLQPLVVTSSAATSDPRFTVLSAAHQDQFAGPLPGAGRPAFSYLALGGLRGWADADGDGEISASEVHGYVGRAMRALVRDRKQEPTLLGDEAARLARSGSERGPDLSEIVLETANSPASSR